MGWIQDPHPFLAKGDAHRSTACQGVESAAKGNRVDGLSGIQIDLQEGTIQERAKPRAVVRQVTVITLVVLAMAVFMSPQFFAPYTTPMGSLLAAALAATYLCCLVMLRRKTVPPPAPRFLRSQP